MSPVPTIPPVLEFEINDRGHKSRRTEVSLTSDSPRCFFQPAFPRTSIQEKACFKELKGLGLAGTFSAGPSGGDYRDPETEEEGNDACGWGG